MDEPVAPQAEAVLEPAGAISSDPRAMTDLLQFEERPFTAVMAREAGISRGMLQRLKASGQVRSPLRHVYVAAAAPDSLDLRARAAALVLPPHVVVADRAAAWLHGVDVLDFAELDVVPDLDAVSTDGHGRTRRDGIFGGKRDLAAGEVMTLPSGVLVTTPVRTACDIACLLGRLRAIATLDEFRRKHQLSQHDLQMMSRRFRGRRGVIQLRELIPLSTDCAESQPESWTRLLIHDQGLPIPEPQVELLVPGWGGVRMENAYRHLRIAVEYDGVEHHTVDGDRERDDGRRGVLDADGWAILVLRRGDFTLERRREWLDELAVLIADRTPEQPAKRRYSRAPDHPSYRWRRRR